MQAFPGHGQMKAEQQEIERLRREVARLKAERDILKRPQPSSRKKRHEVRLHREAPGGLAGGMAMRRVGGIAVGLPCLAESLAQRQIPQLRLQSLRARPRRRRLPKDSGDRQLETVPANLLDRQFAAERPNQKWIADFTYLWTAEGWL